MFPFDDKARTLIIGDSFRFERQYDMIRYDFKPKSIDAEKEGILETDDNKCTIRLPHIEAARNINYEGKRTSDGKECLIIVNHDTGEITLERVNTISNVKNKRGSTGETYVFKTRTPKPPPPKQAKREPLIQQSPETQQKRPPKPNRNVPSPVVIPRKKFPREEELTNEIELPSIIEHKIEHKIESRAPAAGILGLESPKIIKDEPIKHPIKPPEAPSGLFSTSEESESDSSDGTSSGSSDDEQQNSSSDNSENESDDESQKQPNPPPPTGPRLSTGKEPKDLCGLGLILSDESDDDSS